MSEGRILVWFSCGAASATAAKVAVDAFAHRREVVVANVDMSADEHPDNQRFLLDVQRWIGQEIVKVKSDKYSSIYDVFLQERYIAGVQGAACTKRLKRWVQAEFAKPDDTIVLGMTYDEQDRIQKVVNRNPQEKFMWLLADNRITKDDCYHVLNVAGIELPVMYKLGFHHNNCLGCVKGGKWYWNRIRKHFPERFNRMAEIEREIGYPVLRDVYLDELDPRSGRKEDEPNISCGFVCDGVHEIVPLAVNRLKETPTHATN